MGRRELIHARGRRRVPVLATLAVITAACIVPLPRVKPQVGPQRIGEVRVGVTTKQEVRSLLREPSVELTEYIWVYQWFTRKFNVFAGAGAPGGGAPIGGGAVVPVGVRDYRALVVFGQDGRVARFDVLRRQEQAEADGPDLSPSRTIELPVKGKLLGQVRFVAGSDQIATGCGYADICSWRADAPDSVIRWEAPGRGGSGEVRLSPRGQIAAAGIKETVLLLTAEGAWETVRPSGRGTIGALAFSTDGSLLAVSRRKTTVVLDVSSHVEIARVDSPGTAEHLEFSPDGSLLTASIGERVHVFHVADGSLGGSVRKEFCHGFAFSPDGSRLAVHGGSYVAVYRVADIARGRDEVEPSQIVLLPFGRGKSLNERNPCGAWQVVFSPSARRLAAVSDGAAVVVDLSCGSVVEVLPHLDDVFHGLTFREEDRLLTVQRTGVFEWVVPGPAESQCNTERQS